MNKIINESSEGANITKNNQGGGDNGNKPSTTNETEHNGGSNFATGASASTIYAEDGQTPGTFLNKTNKKLPAGANTSTTGGINVETGASTSTTAAEYGQTTCTQKRFAYSKQILIAKKSLFWMYYGGRVSGEVAFILENTDMYGKVFNIPRPIAGIHPFFLKWYMARVPDVIPLQEYPPTVNIPLSNANKLLLQTSINESRTVGYKFSSPQSSTSSSDYSRQRTWNQQHQQYKASVLPLISGIHRPSRISIIYLYE